MTRIRKPVSGEVMIREAPVICVLKIGGIGSVVTTLPLIAALKDTFPHSRVVYITNPPNLPLIRRYKGIDQSFAIDPCPFPLSVSQGLSVIRELRRIRPSIFLDLQIHTHRHTSAAIAHLSGSSVRLGFWRSSDWLRSRVFDEVIHANLLSPVHELYLQMARALGCKVDDGLTRISLTIADQDRAHARGLLEGWCEPPTKLLIVNPNASEKARVRRWPIEFYAAAVSRVLGAVENLKVGLIGLAAEFDYVEELRRRLADQSERVRNLAGESSLGSLLALLQRADCLLTNDSGPLHLGLALETPTVGLFGPVHPDHYARLGDPAKKIIFYRPLLCSPCVHHVKTPSCGGKGYCMRFIAPEEVSEACLYFLSPAGEISRSELQEWRFADYPRMVAQDRVPLGIWRRRILGWVE